MADSAVMSDAEVAQDRIVKRVRDTYAKTYRRPNAHPDGKDRYQAVEEIPTAHELRQTIIARLRRAIEHRRPHEEDWERILRAWFLLPSTIKEDGWESNRFIPLLFKHTETAHPLLVRGTLDDKGLWKVEGMSRKGHDVAAPQEGLLNWQGDTSSGAREAHEDKTWWMVQIGNGYVFHDWAFERDRRLVTKWVDDPDQPGKKIRRTLEEEITVMDGPRLECLDPLNVWLDPMSKPGDDIEWFHEFARTTKGSLRAAAGKGHIDADALEEWFEKGNTGWGQDPEAAAQGFQIDGALTWRGFLESVGHEAPTAHEDGEQDLSDDQDVVSVLRYVSKKCTVTLGDAQHLIGYSANTNTHGKTGLVTAQLYKVPGSAYGRGLGHVLLGHQELTNENINRFMDTAVISLLAPVIVDKNKMSVLDDEWVWEPNKLFRSRGGVDGVLKRAEVPAPTDLALRLDSHLALDADDTTGFAAQARGIQPSASTSATAFKGVAGNLGARLTVLLERVGRSVSQSGQLVLDMNLQFLSVEQVVTVRGEEGLDYVTVRPEEIAERNLVRASISAGRTDPDAVAARMIQILQVFAPLLQAGLEKSPSIGRIMRATLLAAQVPNVDLIIPKLPSSPRDAITESAYLAGGGYFPPDPRDDHLAHYQAHMAKAQQLEAEQASGAYVHPSAIAVLMEHANAHMVLGTQMGSAMLAGSPAGGAPGAAAGNRAEPGGAQDLGGGAGSNGVPGVAAPGPVAAAGRPL